MPWPKGKPMTSEMIEKARANRKPRSGHRLSQETKDKISLARTGKKYGPLSEAHRKAISEGNKGKKKSEETRDRMRQKQLATWRNDPDHKSKTHTEEARRKRSISISRARTGRKQTEAEREGNRQGKLRLWASFTPEQWAEYTAKLKPKGPKYVGTSIEIAIRRALDLLGVVYEYDIQISRYQIDIYVPLYKLIVECDGTYWHGRPEQVERDKRKDAWLTNLGYKVVRLGESEIRNDPVSAARRALSEVCDDYTE